MGESNNSLVTVVRVEQLDETSIWADMIPTSHWQPSRELLEISSAVLSWQVYLLQLDTPLPPGYVEYFSIVVRLPSLNLLGVVLPSLYYSVYLHSWEMCKMCVILCFIKRSWPTLVDLLQSAETTPATYLATEQSVCKVTVDLFINKI